MTTHKAFALLYFLLCFCFLSTGYAQPCLADNNSANDSHCQLSLEDLPESSALLNNNQYITSSGHTVLFIENTPLEKQRSHTLPCCNRGPPPLFL
ncbi:hypothetical protein [Colwellia sp. 12G3]|uniref:hypothetical protein n=1 Tax=Colwellia sp. 12G3 TaxID=2058299 RepID=UPI000C323EC0|nr:hypothetical protein [Colwellia sp. 12G3]PKI17896.1 hypothetical protein CXF71_01575 [Colwellia sp. 12G3]